MATLMLLGLVSCDDSPAEPTTVEGTWVVTEYERELGEVLEDIPETLPGERWTVTPREGCEGADCPFDLTTTALEGAPRPIEMELRPEGDGTYVADLDFVSQCIEPSTGRVLEPKASNVSSTYRVRLAEGPELEIVFDWEGEPTDRGIEAGCDIRSARFVAVGQPESR